MAFPPLIRPRVYAHPTLDTAFWFLRLRWIAVFGQLITLIVAYSWIKAELPIAKIAGLIGVTAVTNLPYWYWLHRLRRRGLSRIDRLPTDQVISALMFVDILVLTGLLHLSAGLANPFRLFYFVNIAMAAAIITPAAAWLLWACTVACVFLLLTSKSYRIEMLTPMFDTSEQAGMWTVPKFGFFISFATCSAIITHFITILTGELRHREHAITDAEEAKSRNRQLESLTTLAGGAAHELASPLSTIAVVAKELGRTLEKQTVPASVMDDVGLIRSELDRCRQILDRMTTATGEAAGEQLHSIHIDDFLEETLLGVRNRELVSLHYDCVVRDVPNLLPVQAAAQALRNLVQNALDANRPESHVHVSASLDSGQWLIEVTDQGHGMPEEVRKRLGEPFFTTKEPGKGMGLGVYLAMNVVRRLDGTLDFESQSGQGTTARVRLPVRR